MNKVGKNETKTERQHESKKQIKQAIHTERKQARQTEITEEIRTYIN